MSAAERFPAPGTVLTKQRDIVCRRIGEEFILVPVVASVADVDTFFTVNPTGAAIWELLDGSRSLGGVAQELGKEYEGSADELESAVVEFAGQLLEARLVLA